MKIVNKKIIVALLALTTLTACDSLTGGQKEKAEETKVEENANTTADSKDAKEGEEAGKNDDAENKEATDANKEEGKEGEATETTDADSNKQAITSEGSTPKEQLEDAIFNNRVAARAAEILLETTPETVADIADQLKDMIQQSNDLIQQAEEALQSL